MKNKKPRAYIPIYAFAVAWIVCAFFIPMYTLAGLAGSAAVSAAAAVVAYYTAGFILSKRPAKAEPEPEPVKKEEPALSPEVQAIIDDGKRAMKEMGRLYSSIKNNDVRKRINELMRVSDKIVQDAVDDPSDVPQIRKFLDYYLPTTIKLLNAYDRMLQKAARFALCQPGAGYRDGYQRHEPDAGPRGPFGRRCGHHHKGRALRQDGIRKDS